ncbi:hypothetical protein PR048_004017 [Dryococelus australis]|uniref:Uncharacterized protein n=1 Tax=Dryococelus australis TaxID=614101 RepID=A0ABQ9I5F8_9NEOP|nr:hypothetical protein PR048_004017 [Dryococelus australis]
MLTKDREQDEVPQIKFYTKRLKAGVCTVLQTEEWYPLTGITPIGEWGSLRMRTRYLHDLIMPQEEYSPMQQLILDPSLEVVRALADICHLDRVPLASSLLRIFRYNIHYSTHSHIAL